MSIDREPRLITRRSALTGAIRAISAAPVIALLGCTTEDNRPPKEELEAFNARYDQLFGDLRAVSPFKNDPTRNRLFVILDEPEKNSFLSVYLLKGARFTSFLFQGDHFSTASEPSARSVQILEMNEQSGELTLKAMASSWDRSDGIEYTLNENRKLTAQRRKEILTVIAESVAKIKSLQSGIRT